MSLNHETIRDVMGVLALVCFCVAWLGALVAVTAFIAAGRDPYSYDDCDAAHRGGHDG